MHFDRPRSLSHTLLRFPSVEGCGVQTPTTPNTHYLSLYPHHTLSELIFHFKHSLAHLLLLITNEKPFSATHKLTLASLTPPYFFPPSETTMKALNSTLPRASRRGRTGTLTASTAPLWTTSRGKTSCREALRGTHVHAEHLYLYPAFARLLCASIYQPGNTVTNRSAHCSPAISVFE